MKIKHITLCSLFAYSVTIPCAQYNIPQLLREFKKVGTFKPQAPHDFNEQRAWEIVRLMEIAAPTGAIRLELDLRRSLDVRSGSTGGAQPELARLQEENLQLRNHARHLQEENGRLRKKKPSETSTPEPQGEIQNPKASSNEQTAFQERAHLAIKLATDIITDVNDLTLNIAQATHQLEKNNTAEAQQALNEATKRIGTIIIPKRNQLEEIVLTKA